MPDPVTLEEAARQLGISPRWLRARVDSGRIASEERNGRRYVSLAEVRDAAVEMKKNWRTESNDVKSDNT